MPEDNYDPMAKKLYRPEVSPARVKLAIAVFVLMLGVTTVLLWYANVMTIWQQALGLVVATAGMSLVGWLCEAGGEKGVAKAPVVIAYSSSNNYSSNN